MMRLIILTGALAVTSAAYVGHCSAADASADQGYSASASRILSAAAKIAFKAGKASARHAAFGAQAGCALGLLDGVLYGARMGLMDNRSNSIFKGLANSAWLSWTYGARFCLYGAILGGCAGAAFGGIRSIIASIHSGNYEDEDEQDQDQQDQGQLVQS